VLKHRVIPALLLRNGGLVKTTQFKDPKYVGDPINAIRIFNDKEVDELMVLDITASKEQREPNYALIEQFAGECFMPLAYGGGIRSAAQARQLFSLGVEKICLQTAAMENSTLISELANQFGSQSVIVSVDVKKNWLGKPKLYQSATGRLMDAAWMDKLHELVSAGAGEVLLNVVDKDGTLAGPDLLLIQQGSAAVEVPLIALGGVSSLADIKACVDAGASAVAAGAFFVYHGPHRAVLITYPKYHELEQLFEGSA
jgi:imidazole glycerol-phosphate synthase subunit HisF